MADPILLPDCPDLRARAEAIARARFERMESHFGSLSQRWAERPVRERSRYAEAALAELRDLSTPTGRDHACRWLWALLTGEEPEWCPVWFALTESHFGLMIRGFSRNGWIDVINSGRTGLAGYDASVGRLYAPGTSDMTHTEALAAAIAAALDWRRGRP